MLYFASLSIAKNPCWKCANSFFDAENQFGRPPLTGASGYLPSSLRVCPMQSSLRLSSSVDLSKTAPAPRTPTVCGFPAWRHWSGSPPSAKARIAGMRSAPQAAFLFQKQVNDGQRPVRMATSPGSERLGALQPGSDSDASASIAPGSGRSSGPPGCRANRPGVPPCTGAASGHGQPPNRVRW